VSPLLIYLSEQSANVLIRDDRQNVMLIHLKQLNIEINNLSVLHVKNLFDQRYKIQNTTCQELALRNSER